MYLNWRLFQFTATGRGALWAGVALGMLATGFGIVRLGLLGWLIAKLFAGAPAEALIGPALFTIAVMFIRAGLDYARTALAHHTAARLQMNLRHRLHDHVMALGPRYLDHTRTGDVVSAVCNGVEELETYLGQYLPQLVIAVATPLVLLVITLWIDPVVALVLTAAALLALFAPTIFHIWNQQQSLERQQAYAGYSSDLLDALQGLPTLKAFGQSTARGRVLAARAQRLFQTTMWILATNSASRGIADSGIALGVAATLTVGSLRVLSGDMELAGLLMILMVGVEAYRPLRDLRGLLHQGMLGESAARGIFALLDQRPQQPAPAAGAQARPTEHHDLPAIQFRDVHFAYPSRDNAAPVYRGLDFAVAPGERVAVVGPSGAGKSTLLKLLLRFYDPDRGSIALNGYDIAGEDLETIRQQLAVVSQDGTLFHGTVAENLRMARPDADDAALVDAAKSANAHEFIQQLPAQYDTIIGERGMRLSGGQRQRLAIARAILKQAPILILDEALSSVDAENEAVIQSALHHLMQGRTSLIFAHRLSSVVDADRILVLENGVITESGSHDELIQKDGLYRTLMAAQLAEASDETAMQTALPSADAATRSGPTQSARSEVTPLSEGILRAEGMGWAETFRALFQHILPWKGRLTVTFSFGVLRIFAFIGVSALAALSVAQLKQGTDPIYTLVALFILAPIAGFLHWFESWIAHDMAFRLLADMRMALYRKLDALAPGYMVRRRSGDLLATATEDVDRVEYFYAHTVAPAFVAVLVPVLVLSILLAADVWLAVTLLPFLALVACSPFAMRHHIDTLGGRAREALGDLNAHTVDTIQGLSEVAALQAEQERRQGLQQRMEHYYAARNDFNRDLTLQHVLVETATGLGGLAVIVTGGFLVQEGRVDVAWLPLFSLLAMAAFLPISEIAEIGRQLADTLGATRRLYAVHHEPVTVQDGPGATPDTPSATPPPIEVDDVQFHYPGHMTEVLQGIRFTIPSGTTTAIVGASGAGKTTLGHLLLRFWDPSEGSIRLGGRDLRDYKLDELRSYVSLVAQDTYLFNDTLEANIRLAKPDASPEALAEAIAKAALSETIEALPDGLATRVGERGTRLSGGQRQRVAIARAFLKDAPILLLDEATSHLDTVSELTVRRALDSLMQNRTTIVIAHRLSTIRNADQIAVLDQGRIAEIGSHRELIAAGGLYHRLIRRQTGAALGVAAGA